MPDLQIGNVLLMPLIVALVQVAKMYGLPARWSPVLVSVLAVLGYGLMVVVDVNPDLMVWVQHGVNVIVVFLSSAGLYSTAKFAANGGKKKG